MYKKIVVVVFALLCLHFRYEFEPAKTKEVVFSFSSEKELAVGEEITYVVKYYLLKLGEIKLRVLSKKNVDGKAVYGTIAYIDSYSGIPLVDLHQVYESKENSQYYSNYFKGLVKKPEYTTYTEYFFDHEKGNVKVK